MSQSDYYNDDSVSVNQNQTINNIDNNIQIQDENMEFGWQSRQWINSRVDEIIVNHYARGEPLKSYQEQEFSFPFETEWMSTVSKHINLILSSLGSPIRVSLYPIYGHNVDDTLKIVLFKIK